MDKPRSSRGLQKLNKKLDGAADDTAKETASEGENETDSFRKLAKNAEEVCKEDAERTKREAAVARKNKETRNKLKAGLRPRRR